MADSTRLRRIISFAVVAAGILDPGMAYSSPPGTEGESLAQNMAQQLAALFTLTLRNTYVASRWNSPETGDFVLIRTIIPFKVWDQSNLLRFSIPYGIHTLQGAGVGDVRTFDLVTFETKWGFWGVGPDFNFGLYRGPNFSTFQAGPAAAFALSSLRRWRLGLLNQNLFSNDVAASSVQPIVIYLLSDQWTVGLGDFPLIYNWNTGQFAFITLGLQIGFQTRLGGEPIRFYVEPQYNTRSNEQLFQWAIAAGVTLRLEPTGGK